VRLVKPERMKTTIEVTKILGGGTSWFYLIQDSRFLDSAHEDDATLAALKPELEAAEAALIVARGNVPDEDDIDLTAEDIGEVIEAKRAEKSAELRLSQVQKQVYQLLGDYVQEYRARERAVYESLRWFRDQFAAIVKGESTGATFDCAGQPVTFSKGYLVTVACIDYPIAGLVESDVIALTAGLVHRAGVSSLSVDCYGLFSYQDGFVSIDANQHHSQLAPALALARKCQQVSIWDCARGVPLDVAKE
jgi:hypothetical protein